MARRHGKIGRPGDESKEGQGAVSAEGPSCLITRGLCRTILKLIS